MRGRDIMTTTRATRRAGALGTAVAVLLGLAAAGVSVPPALAEPGDPPPGQSDGTAEPTPNLADVTEVSGASPVKAADVPQRVLHASWPAGDVNPAGNTVRVQRGKKTRAGTSIVRVGLPSGSGQEVMDARVRVLPPARRASWWAMVWLWR